MKIKLHSSATMFDATVAMISGIDNSDFDVEHVIIVPDRFSLQCEKLILNLLPQKALFNVRVTSLTRFSVELLRLLGVKLEKGDVLSSGQTLLLTQKAIENVAKDFKTLKKSGIDFCYEVSKLISQFKSSGVRAEDLNSGAGGMAGNKYHDFALIYDEYERLLGDKLDANARLALLNEKLKDSEILADKEIYFANFEAFTKGGYDLIKAFACSARGVNISIAQPVAIGNEYIYEKDIQEKVTALSKECGVMVEVQSYPQVVTHQKQAIIKGLYSYQKTYCDNDGFYNIYSCMSVTEEVEAVAKLIRYRVFKGDSYRDIQIAAGALGKARSQIENIFTQYNIPFYIDSSVTADKTILANLVRAYFETVIFGYNHDKLVDLFANQLSGGGQELIEKCQHLRIDNKQGYKRFIEKDFLNAVLLSKLEKCSKADEFEDVVKEILSSCEEKYLQMLDRLKEKGDIKERNINAQVAEIILENISLITQETQQSLSASEYFKLLWLLLSFKSVSTVPTYADGVFVGDASVSYFGQSKVLIVLDGENLPIISNDNGLLSDEELLLNGKNPIEPTIRMLNRRARFRLFNMLPLGQERLFVFIQSLDEDGKKREAPTYIKNLNSIFGQKQIKAGNIFLARKSEDLNINLLSAPLKKKGKDVYQKNWQTDLCKALVFNGGYARVTQLEQYFACPFKHFASYGLRLKEFEIQLFQPRDIGNICHKAAEIFIRQMMKENSSGQWSKEKIQKFIENKFKYIIESENLTEKLSQVVERKSLEKFLKNQILVLLMDIVKEQQDSHFRPYKIEESFDNLIEGVDIPVVGKADRIDVCGGYFRIIDYKTGTTGNILKELYFGQKLQLILYQKFAGQKLNKNLGGVFYFDAKFDYDKDDKGGALLKGLAPKDDTLIPLLSSSIEVEGKSRILSISKSKKDGSYIGSTISPVDMGKLADYAEKITAKAIEEIENGYITPKPSKDACRACKFAPLCGYEIKNGTRKTELNKTKDNNDE